MKEEKNRMLIILIKRQLNNSFCIDFRANAPQDTMSIDTPACQQRSLDRHNKLSMIWQIVMKTPQPERQHVL